jgi:hypothetical protein
VDGRQQNGCLYNAPLACVLPNFALCRRLFDPRWRRVADVGFTNITNTTIITITFG